MLQIIAYTDGSCLPNPGVGGFAAIMQANGKERVCQGYDTNEKSTNNRMELKAVITVIDWINNVQKEPCEVTICTDSKYLINCHTHKRSWLTSESRPNHDLWLELITKGLKGQHKIKFVKVEAHKNNELNNRVDKLAKAQAVKARHERYGI